MNINLAEEEKALTRRREENFLESKILAHQRKYIVDYKTAFEAVRESEEKAGRLPDFRPIGRLSVIRWDTGYMVFDMAEVMKLPKRQRDKILKAGNVSK